MSRAAPRVEWGSVAILFSLALTAAATAAALMGWGFQTRADAAAEVGRFDTHVSAAAVEVRRIDERAGRHEADAERLRKALDDLAALQRTTGENVIRLMVRQRVEHEPLPKEGGGR